jgi:hypothetical protein
MKTLGRPLTVSECVRKAGESSKLESAVGFSNDEGDAEEKGRRGERKDPQKTRTQ